MNEFPKFNPNDPALNQLSSNRMNLISLGQKSNQIQPGLGYRVTQTPGGTTVSVIKRRYATQSIQCPFGEIISIPDSDPPDKGIRGGMVYCGDKNFLVPPYDIDLETASVKKIYLDLNCESNRDDDNEIFLPGVKTSSETTPSTFWTSTTSSYPNNTSPVLATGIGTIIIPLGTLTVADGVATFDPTACGNVTVGQCGGTLSHTRG